ncbi:MAG: 30S ribosomal protein S20 [Clostridia bacterium]|nr:30S ribosomal protein S20 [Clostridia bacterium]MCX4367754.1 30S ribosomal protein S20 [Clostridia bacterium]
MPNIKSQIKRVKTNNQANEINTSKRSKVRNIVKKYEALIAAKDVAGAEKMLPEVVSAINVAKSDGIYHPSTASRKISRVSKALSNLKAE